MVLEKRNLVQQGGRRCVWPSLWKLCDLGTWRNHLELHHIQECDLVMNVSFTAYGIIGVRNTGIQILAMLLS